MRLSEQTQAIINQTTGEVFGPDINVVVFGSRLSDQARGGDIDLLVQSDQLITNARRKSLQLVAKLQIRLGDQPIDVLIIDPQTSMQSIHNEALLTGVKI